MKSHLFSMLLGIVLIAASSNCGGNDGKTSPAPTLSLPDIATASANQVPISFSSPAFADGKPIPAKYTCDGDNVSPPLEWGQPPSGTKTLALVVDDPGAPSGRFTHWIILDLPPTLRGLPEGVATDEKPSQGGANGKNSAGGWGYTGPCPPSGMHHYVFRLFALDTKLNADPNLTGDEILGALSGHAVAGAEFTGTYGRSP